VDRPTAYWKERLKETSLVCICEAETEGNFYAEPGDTGWVETAIRALEVPVKRQISDELKQDLVQRLRKSA